MSWVFCYQGHEQTSQIWRYYYYWHLCWGKILRLCSLFLTPWADSSGPYYQAASSHSASRTSFPDHSASPLLSSNLSHLPSQGLEQRQNWAWSSQSSKIRALPYSRPSQPFQWASAFQESFRTASNQSSSAFSKLVPMKTATSSWQVSALKRQPAARLCLHSHYSITSATET